MAPADRWFDDFEVGEVLEVGDHLMTEERIVSFATEFDPQRFHVDPEQAAESVFGGLVASGWHTGSVMMKLLALLLGPASEGSPGAEALRWSAPVRAGDRLRLRLTVLDKRLSQSRPERGTLLVRTELLNQDRVVVMSLEPALFLRRRPGPGDRPPPSTGLRRP